MLLLVVFNRSFEKRGDLVLGCIASRHLLVSERRQTSVGTPELNRSIVCGFISRSLLGQEHEVCGVNGVGRHERSTRVHQLKTNGLVGRDISLECLVDVAVMC